MFKKYPRTPYLSCSPTITARHPILDRVPEPIVITEKMDGSNVTLYRHGLHARSVNDNCRLDWLKTKHATLAHYIPSTVRIVGEYLYYTHSIFYDNLPSYFLVFAAFDETKCLAWHDVQVLCKKLGLFTVPILYTGLWPENVTQFYTPTTEGFVVRSLSAFEESDFQKHVAKYVRSNHVQTDVHWSKSILKKNRLQE